LAPAWTVAVIDTSSISTISSSERMSTTIPPWIARAAPCVPEPPPHGTTGVPCSSAIAKIAATSASVRG
jgi:hypothetical protein